MKYADRCLACGHWLADHIWERHDEELVRPCTVEGCTCTDSKVDGKR